MKFNRASLFFVIAFFLGVQIGSASDLSATTGRPPRLPNSGDLIAAVKKGPPTSRLKNLAQFDSSSSCGTLLAGEFWSLYFPNIVAAFAKAGLTPQNLEPSERQFLIDAVVLHVATKTRQGNFNDLEGLNSMLDFLGITGIGFAPEYLAVIRYWIDHVPGWGFYISSSTRQDGSEIDYSGQYVRERFVEPDSSKRRQRLQALVVNDYRGAIISRHRTHLHPTDKEMEDFMTVREVLIILSRSLRLSEPRGAQSSEARSLLPDTFVGVIQQLAAPR